jgi:competence protein ComEC
VDLPSGGLRLWARVWLLWCAGWTLAGCDYVREHVGEYPGERPAGQVADFQPTAASPAGARALQPDGLLRVYFFDVGQGDATLLVGPDFSILIDTGRHDRSDVVPHLRAVGLRHLDLLIGTHPHSDHIGQFAAVLRDFPAREVWMSGDQHTSRTFERAVDAILDSGAGYHEPRAGEVLQLGSARIEVLNPRQINGDFHAGCIALRVVYGNIAFMLMGDVEAPQEHHIIQSGFPLRSQILKLGHHGSSTSSSEPFVARVQPAVAIYSAGVGNSYGHPHQVVLQRMQRMGVPIYGTDYHGTILVMTDGQRFEVRTSREAAESARNASSPQVGSTTMMYGTVDLNTASREELLQIVHMTPQRVEELIRNRPIRSWDQLTAISGIGPVRLSEIRQQGRARLE